MTMRDGITDTTDRKKLNQIAVKQELASSVDEKAKIANIKSNKNLMDEAIKYFNQISTLPVIMNPEHPDRIERMAKMCQKYKDIENYLRRVKEERGEMLSLIKECLSGIESSCYEHCSEYSTPECRICDTGKLQKRIKSTIRKAKGK